MIEVNIAAGIMLGRNRYTNFRKAEVMQWDVPPDLSPNGFGTVPGIRLDFYSSRPGEHGSGHVEMDRESARQLAQAIMHYVEEGDNEATN